MSNPSAQIPADKVVTVEEAVALKETAAATGPQWHWMGNFGDPYGPCTTAANYGCGPGAMIVQYQGGIYPTWLYY
ncbi:hypothetical protein [Streptomyces sp. NPDC002521]